MEAQEMAGLWQMEPEERDELCEELITNDPGRTWVEIQHCSDLPAICEALQHNSTVASLILSGRGFGFGRDRILKGAELILPLATAIQEHPALKWLEIRSMSIPEDFNALIFAMSLCETLKNVIFENCSFPLGAADAIVHLLERNNVETMCIKACKIRGRRHSDQWKDLAWSFLAHVERRKHRFEALYKLMISGSSYYFGTAGAKLLRRVFQYFPRLSMLYLIECNIGRSGAVDLVKALRRHGSTVTDLCLACNRLGDEGASVVAYLLRAKWSKVQELDLSSNSISSAGVAALAEGLIANKTLRYLNFGSFPREELNFSNDDPDGFLNVIAEEGAKSLARMLEINSDLKLLTLDGPQIVKEGLSSIVCSFPKMKGLQRFYLDYRDYDSMFAETVPSETLKDIADVLEKNVALELLVDEDCWDEFTGEKAVHAKRIKLLLKLNESGRRLLSKPDIPLSLWAHVLARVSDDPEPNAIFHFLREKPELYERAALNRRKRKRSQMLGAIYDLVDSYWH